MLHHTTHESTRRYHEIEFFVVLAQIWAHWITSLKPGKTRIRAYAIIRLCRQGYEISRTLKRENAKRFFKRYESDAVKVLLDRGARIPS